MANYIISGLGPGTQGGVALLVKNLLAHAQQHQCQIISRYQKQNLKQMFREKKIFAGLWEIAKRIYHKYAFHYKVMTLSGHDIVLIHPQTMGYRIFFNLIHRNRAKMYVVDNGFFCIKSYNYLNLNEKECFQCLDNIVCRPECFSFPVHYPKKMNLHYVKKLKTYADRIHFLTQNKNQSILLKAHFSKKIKCSIIGMDTGEFSTFPQRQDSERKFDIVYHSNAVDAKGFVYALILAKKLTKYRILFPIEKQDEYPDCDHITYMPCRWDSGLQQHVRNARLVLCPSMWSAPIEGALLKSIAENGNVAVYRTCYGFENELPEKMLLRLDDNIALSCARIRHFLENDIDLSEKSRKWLKGLHNNFVDNLFAQFES